MSEKLKPCPFCGSDKRYSYDHKDWCYLRLILTGRSGHMKSCDVDRAFNTRQGSEEVERLRKELSEAVEHVSALSDSIDDLLGWMQGDTPSGDILNAEERRELASDFLSSLTASNAKS